MLMAALLQAAVAPAPSSDDVVVMGRRLETWRGTIHDNASGTTCVTRKSTGDAEIDAIGCTAMQRCWPAMQPRVEAAQAKGVAKADRKRLMDEATQAFAACSRPQRDALIDALHARRAAARDKAA